MRTWGFTCDSLTVLSLQYRESHVSRNGQSPLQIQHLHAWNTKYYPNFCMKPHHEALPNDDGLSVGMRVL